ncbi:MAG: methyltransferase [Phycisphaeraceae bacterium]|nr:methyltransferase [Phycisphaeraceae bacterium]
MPKIELSCVAVVHDTDGELVRLRLSHAPATAGPPIQLVNIVDDGGVCEQLDLARLIAGQFVRREYVRPLLVHDIEQGRLILESDQPNHFHGGSFGLTLLAGLLALAFDVPLRRGRLFSAKLEDCRTGSGDQGGMIQLLPVAGTGPKLAAACWSLQEVLFLRSGDERRLVEFERNYWRGEGAYACRPYALPQTLSCSALIAAALDGQFLSERLQRLGSDGAAMAAQLLAVSQELDHTGSLIAGIGNMVASLCSSEALPSPGQLHSLCQACGTRPYPNLQFFLRWLTLVTVDHCEQDETKREWFAAAVMQCIPRAPDTLAAWAIEPDELRYQEWLQSVQIGNLYDLIYVLQVSTLAKELLTDLDSFMGLARQMITQAIRVQLEELQSLITMGNVRNAGAMIEGIIRSSLGRRVALLSMDWMPEAVGLVNDCSARLMAVSTLHDHLKALERSFRAWHVPEVLKPLLQRTDPVLRFGFRLSGNTGVTEQARPPLTRVNDLDLDITGRDHLHLTMPSPVLLLESSSVEPSYCRRQAFVDADDTLNRYPVNDAAVVRDRYHQEKVLIAFDLPGGDVLNAPSILWDSATNPWPPAIDTQLLLAAMAHHTLENDPHSLLDVGCGTGYIAIVAAHLWPSLDVIHLLDLDEISITAAAMSARHDNRVSQMQLVMHQRPFQNMREDFHVDVLVCNPPYLPNRPLPQERIQLATNGTALLENVVGRGYRFASEIWLTFSVLAWPEFQYALAATPNAYRRIELLARNYVPFRIPWLAPVSPQENQRAALTQYQNNIDYYQHTLRPRHLIDLDDVGFCPATYLQDIAPTLPGGVCALDDMTNARECEKIIDNLLADSRGYRFWHEIRVLRLSA